MKQLIGFLDSLNFDSTAIDLVLVEKQPSRNCKMRIIEHILLTFFLAKGFNNVLSFNPKLKLGSLRQIRQRETKLQHSQKIRHHFDESVSVGLSTKFGY